MQNLKVNRILTKVGISLFGIVLLLFSCDNNTFNDKEALLKYLKEEQNGYIQHKSINGVDFTLMYRPTDVLVNQELSDDTDDKEIEELREKYKKYLYFNLSMSKNNQELLNTVSNNKNEFGQMVNQLAFGMNEKVHLFTQRKDTLEMVDFIYPRMYGMSRSTSMLFVYTRDKKKLKEDYLNFTIEDLGLYTGEVKFKIESELIKNEPKLNL